MSWWGNISKLTDDNYDEWKGHIILILSAIGAHASVPGEDPAPQLLDFNCVVNYDDWKVKQAEAASKLRRSSPPEEWRIVKCIRNSHEMWNTLETSLDTAGLYMGRQDILCQFCGCVPKEDKPRKAYFTKLGNYCVQQDHTDNAITNRKFCTQIFTSLPSLYAMKLMVLKHGRLLPTPDEAMHVLLEDDTTASLTNIHGDASTRAALFTQLAGLCGRSRGRGGCSGLGGSGGQGGQSGQGGGSGTGVRHESTYTF